LNLIRERDQHVGLNIILTAYRDGHAWSVWHLWIAVRKLNWIPLSLRNTGFLVTIRYKRPCCIRYNLQVMGGSGFWVSELETTYIDYSHTIRPCFHHAGEWKRKEGLTQIPVWLHVKMPNWSGFSPDRWKRFNLSFDRQK
jgi:hypothetical protein